MRKMPKGSDKNFNAALNKQHAKHAHFSSLASASAAIKRQQGVADDEVFIIHHFAGDVAYASSKSSSTRTRMPYRRSSSRS